MSAVTRLDAIDRVLAKHAETARSAALKPPPPPPDSVCFRLYACIGGRKRIADIRRLLLLAERDPEIWNRDLPVRGPIGTLMAITGGTPKQWPALFSEKGQEIGALLYRNDLDVPEAAVDGWALTKVANELLWFGDAITLAADRLELEHGKLPN